MLYTAPHLRRHFHCITHNYFYVVYFVRVICVCCVVYRILYTPVNICKHPTSIFLGYDMNISMHFRHWPAPALALGDIPDAYSHLCSLGNLWLESSLSLVSLWHWSGDTPWHYEYVTLVYHFTCTWHAL